jgi:FCD domain
VASHARTAPGGIENAVGCFIVLAVVRMKDRARPVLPKQYVWSRCGGVAAQLEVDATANARASERRSSAEPELLYGIVFALRERHGIIEPQRQGDRIGRSREEHEAIMQAIAEGDGETAARRMRAHVERGRGAHALHR